MVVSRAVSSRLGSRPCFMGSSRFVGLAPPNQAAQASSDQIRDSSASAWNTAQPSNKYMAFKGTFLSRHKMNALSVKYQPSIRSWRLCACIDITADSVVDGGRIRSRLRRRFAAAGTETLIYSLAICRRACSDVMRVTRGSAPTGRTERKHSRRPSVHDHECVQSLCPR